MSEALLQVGARQDDDELVAAVAGGEALCLPGRGVDESGDLAQNPAAGHVAVAVVHVLEVVEVDEQQSDVGAAARSVPLIVPASALCNV